MHAKLGWGNYTTQRHIAKTLHPHCANGVRGASLITGQVFIMNSCRPFGQSKTAAAHVEVEPSFLTARSSLRMLTLGNNRKIHGRHGA